MDTNLLYKQTTVNKLIELDKMQGFVNHAYLLHGKSADVLKWLSFNVASHLICENKNAPCGTCATCLRVLNNNYSDLHVYPKTKTLKTEDANDIVSESYVKPLENKYKVFILNEFEKATISAQNKLLKTIEEPSQNVVFIITTTTPSGVANTILSRCKKIHIGENEMEELALEIESGSSIEKAQKQQLKIAIQDSAFDVLINMKKSNEILQYSVKVMEFENNLVEFINAIQSTLLDVEKIILTPNISLDLLTYNTQNYVEYLKKIAPQLNPSGINKIFKTTLSAIKQLQANCNKNAVVENILMKILEVKYENQQ